MSEAQKKPVDNQAKTDQTVETEGDTKSPVKTVIDHPLRIEGLKYGDEENLTFNTRTAFDKYFTEKEQEIGNNVLEDIDAEKARKKSLSALIRFQRSYMKAYLGQKETISESIDAGRKQMEEARNLESLMGLMQGFQAQGLVNKGKGGVYRHNSELATEMEKVMDLVLDFYIYAAKITTKRINRSALLNRKGGIDNIMTELAEKGFLEKQDPTRFKANSSLNKEGKDQMRKVIETYKERRKIIGSFMQVNRAKKEGILVNGNINGVKITDGVPYVSVEKEPLMRRGKKLIKKDGTVVMKTINAFAYCMELGTDPETGEEIMTIRRVTQLVGNRSPHKEGDVISAETARDKTVLRFESAKKYKKEALEQKAEKKTATQTDLKLLVPDESSEEDTATPDEETKTVKPKKTAKSKAKKPVKPKVKKTTKKKTGKTTNEKK